MTARCFTLAYSGLGRQLITDAQIQATHLRDGTLADHLTAPMYSLKALWDTGATNSCISGEYAKKLDLQPVSRQLISTPSGKAEKNVYVVNIVLPNQVGIRACQVIEADLEGFDMLIGMNVITMGDFVISNFEGKTMFSFRIPSLQAYDFVIDKHLTPHTVAPTPRRNDPCPCGSGKKYKKCCGRSES